jgi:hypothetical protein
MTFPRYDYLSPTDSRSYRRRDAVHQFGSFGCSGFVAYSQRRLILVWSELVKLSAIAFSSSNVRLEKRPSKKRLVESSFRLAIRAMPTLMTLINQLMSIKRSRQRAIDLSRLACSAAVSHPEYNVGYKLNR